MQLRKKKKMATDENDLLLCYHKGCGKKFNPKANKNDSCRYHSGVPVFHDAYKGWSCCNKKCIDFTEFLNIPGCTVSQHSNEKPPEIIKLVESNPAEVIEVKPIQTSTLVRPPFETPMVNMKCEIGPSLQQLLDQEPTKPVEASNIDESSTTVTIGTLCKNGGCGKSYEGEDSDTDTCIYHPGCPIFHEGLKYWSCCQKRTSDFNAFLNQVGCARGSHVWVKNDTSETIQCRWDWHQTGNYVALAIYAKQYCPQKCNVQLNPIRANVQIYFPQEKNYFKLDLELCRMINVNESSVCMYGTKVEIKMRKAEPGSWAKLNIPRQVGKKIDEKTTQKIEALAPQIESVNLDDL